jgi:putative holliday junction resolvase
VGRVLAVDTGTRRVGLAITDPLGMICAPLAMIPFVSESGLARSLTDLAREKDVTLVVIGLPVSADGSEGEGCARARRIRDRLLSEGLACELWDESWSSRDAADALRAVGARPRGARGRLDSMAASLILRDYMENAARARPPERASED